SYDGLRERILGRIAGVLRVAEEMQRDALDARGVTLAQRRERAPVACLRSRHENGGRELLVDERGVEMITAGWTTLRGGGLHGAPTLISMALLPELVVPRLRGTLG